ncbi:cytoplasmic protein [Guyanagaster necrorhizus]|uniref:Cytoplasmic protein n=1 Tax=Guyanagaster necrorhizus TaxID=856835 RepID=A0A9P7VS38_9AGAR|nr:cytoplasmic protein [Guyanagaster necrorhizus MCA 3950]KAG7446416.1 cytoplasmic protein [Guyanagaster necrorhizus MCA 3950]
MWEPLPLIVYGHAVHPLSPSRRDTRWSSRNRDRLSVVTEASSDDQLVYRDVVALEVGDEVYAFEKYVPKGREVEGTWYRGYVVCTTRRPPVTWAVSGDSSLTKSPPKSEEPQQVFIGIFPASHIFLRDELSDAEGRLHDYVTSVNGSATSNGIGHFKQASSSTETFSQWAKDKGGSSMHTLREEDEDFDRLTTASRRSFRLGPPPEQASSLRAGLPVYSNSLRSSSPADSQLMKPLPPRPSLKSGDDTASGAAQPIIDEIASALREWHTLMFQYLARRDYKLFHIVKGHIEALHLGRLQLLAETLSAEETVNMRRDCVTRLVSGNLVQRLDVIVRHPSWGGLVTVDVEGDVDERSWVSAVRMFAMQSSLAYLDVSVDESLSPRPYLVGSSMDYLSSAPLPTPAHSAFSDSTYPRNQNRIRPSGYLSPPIDSSPDTAKFYHVFLDLRAFVASPCAPGETAELFFSLYRHKDNQFITEEFCTILNHNGVSARYPSNRIRTLFIDLAHSDIQDPTYLVCRIIRNGSLKIGNGLNSTTSLEGRRGSEASVRTDAGASTGWIDNNGTQLRAPTDILGQFRRPFGCAILELTQLGQIATEGGSVSAMREYSMPIYVPTNEVAFSMIHQNIINNAAKKFEKSSRAEMLAVSVKAFRGDTITVVKENTSLLQDIPQTLRLGFPDVVFPGDVRNELYVKLWSGDFMSMNGASGRISVSSFTRSPLASASSNVQVTVEVRDQDGRTVESVISQGSGEPLVTHFHSMVFQRCSEPTFGELIKIRLPLSGIPQWHLFFTFRNRSGRERGNWATPESDRPFAFAFQQLFPDTRAFVEDGSHRLIMYKADKLGTLSPDIYLNAPSSLPGGQKLDQLVFPEMLRVAPPTRDTLTVRTSLCSTKFTQNPVLLSLLNWEKVADQGFLSTVLTKFTFVGEGEIVKFLPDIFDSLFGIMVSPNNQACEMDPLVFNALVTVLGIVQDRRFSNFQPVLDVYIEKHFNCALASSHMIQSMNRLLANPTSTETASPLRAALKVWHYVMKFIAKSRELQKAKELGVGGGVTAEHLEATFKRELRSHLTEVTRLMSTSSPLSIVGTQTIALQHFTSILPELAKIFSIVDLVSIVTTFATNAATAARGKIVVWKLIMYLQIVKGFLFDNPQSRPLLVEAVVQWIRPHFGRYDEYAQTQGADSEGARDSARVAWLENIRLCVAIIAVMLDKLQTSLVSPSVIEDQPRLRMEQENVENLLPLLPRLLDSYREFQSSEAAKALERTRSPKTALPVIFPESYPFSLLSYLPSLSRSSLRTGKSDEVFNAGLGETAIVFLVLALSSPSKHILGFLESSLDIEGQDRFVALMSQFFKVATSILGNDAFPKSWLNVNIMAHKVLVKMMVPISTILEKEFIPPQDSEARFDARLWREAFFMLLKLLSSDQLVIEDFSPQKRRAVWRLAGDIRGEGASIMLSLWQALGWAEQLTNTGEPVARYGGYQVYLNALVGHVVNLCLSHHEQLRNNAVHMLYCMIVSEYHQAGNFDEIEIELVTRLDSLFMSDSKGDDISGGFFVTQLRHMFENSDVDESLRERVATFLDSVDLFLELLLSLRALPEGEEFADERVIATLRLMNFIRRIGRDEIYIKYVHQLVNMHLQSQNYVEAALTLKLHSDLHQWDLNTFVNAMDDLGLPQQSQFHRKETLCLLILDYLGKGKAWERAVDICKELAYQHAEVTFNYGRLSEILRHQATLLEHIITEQRYYSDYYLVTFYGKFPAAIRDKRFIYRGYEWEKYGAFCERMLNKHSGAQLLKIIGDPPVDIRFGTDQYIQCTAVTPEPDRTLPIFTNPDVPTAVREYYEHSAINFFSTSRQVKKLGRDGSDEVWVEKTYFTTEETFPTVLRRSQVIGLEIVELSPVENALTEVEIKTKDLAVLRIRYESLAKTAQSVSTNALSMALNSAVDAPLNTGVASYRQMFFNGDYVARNPDRAEVVERLRVAIDEEVRTIDACLKLHGHLCPSEFYPFHETLEKFFRKNFREEIRRLGIDETSTLPTSSVYEQSVIRSMSSTSTRRAPIIPPISLPFKRKTSSPPPISPVDGIPGVPRQTLLQRHLAHLARHGINGVASSPGDMGGGMTGGSDSVSVESPDTSLVNVNSGTAEPSGSSVMTSLGSLGSLKGRFSRFGSLSFARRGASHS